jgi:hypothetical protein
VGTIQNNQAWQNKSGDKRVRQLVTTRLVEVAAAKHGRASRTIGTALVDYQAMGRGCVFHRNKFVRLGGVTERWDEGWRDRSEEAGSMGTR